MFDGCRVLMVLNVPGFGFETTVLPVLGGGAGLRCYGNGARTLRTGIAPEDIEDSEDAPQRR
jgi:hypothetical protein